MRLVHLAVVLAAACGSPARPPALAPAAAERQLRADTPLTTAAGATVTAPTGWWLTRRREVIQLDDPSRALRAYLIERPEPDGAAAIAAAWQQAQPGFALTPAGPPSSPPAEGGWETSTYVEYQAPAAARRFVAALARRHGGVTYVVLVDADAAALRTRDAQLSVVIESLRPRGLREESLAGARLRPLDAATLDAFVEDARVRLAVPGAAVAVIAGGEVVYERGFGVRGLGDPAPVTPDTLFLLGSVSKSLTTLMQAALVDAGTVRWDSPVTELLPDFALGDPALTRKLVLWHMSCACTGMPQQNLESLFEYGAVTPEARLASMRTMRPTTGFGETYQYSNLMVTAGGYVAAHAAEPTRSLGEAYDRTMQRTVFDPIGMTATTLDLDRVAHVDHAAPHAAALDGAVVELPLAIEHMVTPIRPAGGVWSSLRDMTRLARTELAGGVAPGGRRVVSEANLRERYRVRIASGATSGYGLGLDVGTYRGLRVIEHAGGSFGFRTKLFLLPDPGVAIVILTNTRSAEGDFVAAVLRRAIELLFEGAADEAAGGLAYAVKARAEAIAAAGQDVVRAPDPRWLRGLAGTYRNPSLGTVTITGNVLDVGEWQSRFGRRQTPDGATELVLLDPPIAGGALRVEGEGAAAQLIAEDGGQRLVLAR